MQSTVENEYHRPRRLFLSCAHNKDSLPCSFQPTFLSKRKICRFWIRIVCHGPPGIQYQKSCANSKRSSRNPEKCHINLQESPTFLQKSLVYPQRSPAFFCGPISYTHTRFDPYTHDKDRVSLSLQLQIINMYYYVQTVSLCVMVSKNPALVVLVGGSLLMLGPFHCVLWVGPI